MKFMTEDQNDIAWMHNPEAYAHEVVAETVAKMKDAGVWDEFLQLHQNEDGIVDCDGLYEYLRHESDQSLLDVGLHDNEATATVDEVIAAWEEENAPSKVKREDGKPCVSMMTLRGHTTLDFDVVDENDEETSESLYEDDVVELMRDKHNGNATEGKWDCEDVETAEFEMWRGR